jgi:hypothetical protein
VAFPHYGRIDGHKDRSEEDKFLALRCVAGGRSSFIFLSFGPVMRFLWSEELFPTETPSNKIIWVVYKPWWWTYYHTPLRKPLAMYLHLLVPEIFNKAAFGGP